MTFKKLKLIIEDKNITQHHSFGFRESHLTIETRSINIVEKLLDKENVVFLYVDFWLKFDMKILTINYASLII